MYVLKFLHFLEQFWLSYACFNHALLGITIKSLKTIFTLYFIFCKLYELYAFGKVGLKCID